MKHIFNVLLILLGLFLIVYLLGSFTQVSFNIADWAEEARTTVVLVYALISVFGIGGYIANNIN